MAEKTQKTGLFLLCLMGFAFAARPAQGDGFEQLESRLRDHPTLAAMRLQSVALRENALALAAWPDPVVSVGVNNFPLFNPSFGAFLPTNKALGISQRIPNGDQSKARSKEAVRRAAHNDAAVVLKFAQLRAQLIVALVEKRRIAAQHELLKQQQALCEELAEIIRSEIAAGRPLFFRLAGIDLERVEIARSLAELEGERRVLDARLVDLVGEPADTSPPPLEPIRWNGAGEAFHAVRVALAEIAATESSVEGAEAAWGPDWGIRLTYQQRERGGARTPFPGDDWVSAEVTFSAPLWGVRSQAPALRAAQAQRQAARNRHAAAARTAAAQYAILDAARQTAETAITVYQREIAAIGAQGAALRTNYESGVGDYSLVMDVARSELMLRARIAGERARRDRAVAQLNALMVTP